MNIARARGLAEALLDYPADHNARYVGEQILDALEDEPHPLAPMYPSGFNPSLVRRALDYLLDAYPMFDLVSIDWQLPAPIILYSEGVPQRRWEGGVAGPWVLVKLGQPSEGNDKSFTPIWATWHFAIWKVTGALYTVGADGAVPDDPIWTP